MDALLPFSVAHKPRAFLHMNGKSCLGGRTACATHSKEALQEVHVSITGRQGARKPSELVGRCCDSRGVVEVGYYILVDSFSRARCEWAMRDGGFDAVKPTAKVLIHPKLSLQCTD